MDKIQYSNYTHNYFAYNRRKAWEVNIGDVPLGGNYPVRIQSMTNTFTMDTLQCVNQAIRMIEAGSEYVRIATASIAEAQNLKNIKQELHRRGYKTPLIADVHFNPNVALIAAEIVEKVRINPGNYTDKKQSSEYTSKEYELELERIAERLHPLLKICKQNGTAIRIGTNHGSISDRIINRYGNSPMGMAISAMEYVQICNDFGFHSLVLSMKASDTRIMVQSVRLLVSMLEEKQWYYPLHLGVTEAGNGEYGRIKSAAGIGALLRDGIGDTIRVSLTENPENELPFAKILATMNNQSTAIARTRHEDEAIQEKALTSGFSSYGRNAGKKSPSGDSGANEPVNYNPYIYTKRKTKEINFIGGDNKAIVFSAAETIVFPDRNPQNENFQVINNPQDKFSEDILLIAQSKEDFPMIAWRRLFAEKLDNPVVFKRIYNIEDWEQFYAQATADISTLAIDGLVDGVWIENPFFSPEACYHLSLEILQACQLRYSKAEFISCPSCGRTQYNIEDFLDIIKRKTVHLKGLKIAVMGCIVNGPGEMTDADYGFVGCGNGKITLYKGQTPVIRQIDEVTAVDKLIELINLNGDWMEPSL
jgi:(E)-4-hydroxy-3-methylbut-2-enyl-diphosphate synthase